MNTSENLVSESLEGLCYSHPQLRYIRSEKVICYADIQTMASQQVTLISGGGSGHEPGYAGMVGQGGLAANVAGHVFASPSSSQVLAALERVQSPHGTLVIVMNYTGDCLNFGLAVERAKAKGIKVDMISVGDDVAIGRKKNAKVGRRGMAATVMAIKLAGALAARGAPLEKVRQIVQYTIDHSATLGVAFDHCHVPGSLSLSQLASDELELGMGIHNESGFLKTPLMDAHTMVGRMMDLLTCQEDKDRAYLSLDPGTPVVILVNNLGGLPAIELHLAVKETVEHVLAMGLTLERVYAGSFLSSLNMPGFSISIMTLQDPSILSLLDHPVSLSGWPQAPALSFSSLIEDHPPEQKKEQATLKSSAQVVSVPKMIQAIQGASHAVIQAEPEITQYDTLLGDGDCGQTLKTAALAILDQLPNYPLLSTSDTLLAIAETIETSVGGTSSALYCIFLNALANGLVQHKTADQVWVMALEDALQVLMSYTKARVGDRTLMDTLCPFVESLKTQGFFRSVELAKEGAESTRTMPSHLGRSSYLSSEQVMEANVPDAGAYGLAKLLSGMANGLKES